MKDGETVKSATFSRSRSGDWQVSLTVDVPRMAGAAASGRSGGIDLGLIDLIVESDGHRVSAPRHLDAALAALRRSHRCLARKRRGSANRAKARIRLARRYQRVVHRRNDFTHKETSRLLDKYGLVSIEGLNARGLARTKLARSAQGAAFGELRRQLRYKSETRPSEVVVVDRFFPSSKRCSTCGCINGSLSRRQRSWSCTCGAIHDRDLNAAVNLREEGLRIQLAAGYADRPNVRGVGSALSTKQSTRKRKPGSARDTTSEVLCASPDTGNRPVDGLAERASR